MDALILMRTKLAASYVNGTLDYQRKNKTNLSHGAQGQNQKKKMLVRRVISTMSDSQSRPREHEMLSHSDIK